METKIYTTKLLSELFIQSRFHPVPDYILALEYIYHRLDLLQNSATQSQFNTKVKWLQRLFPHWLLPKLLYRFRYDAFLGFVTTETEYKIFGMISFQKHPQKQIIGMFDVYITPELRQQGSSSQFTHLSDMFYEVYQYYQPLNYKYFQCGKNRETRLILKCLQRESKKKGWDLPIDIETSRIYIQH
ncbi:MAG: hypothetical protein KBC30_01550 [Planctomycetes bacterium]|jgi:hypothetical protein|nr:hypothetical protein [Planctomycetota bacterium]